MVKIVRPRIYIAHSLYLREEVAENVIPKMKLYFDVENPFEHRLALFKGQTEEEIRANREWVRPSWVVKHDLRQIEKCDGMIVLNKGSASYGSVIEASYCFFELGIPVVFVVAEKYQHHPWLNFFGIHVAKDIEEGIMAMRTFFDMSEDFREENLYAKIDKETKKDESKGT